jgi:hypothetical protein
MREADHVAAFIPFAASIYLIVRGCDNTVEGWKQHQEEVKCEAEEDERKATERREAAERREADEALAIAEENLYLAAEERRDDQSGQ